MFKNNSTLFIISCIYYFQFIRCNSDLLRTFQGRDAVSGEFPYAVALAIKFGNETQSVSYKTFCTGSIITPVWILSAGHCVYDVQTYLKIQNSTLSRFKMIIRYTIYSNENHHEWGVSDIINTALYPGYKEIIPIKGHITVTNDIGLLNTNKITISVEGKLSPVDYRTLYGQKVLTAGYGLTKSEKGVDDALSLNKTLQVYETVIVKCSFTFNFRVWGTMRPLFCLSWECKKPARSCSGDSGGPVVHSSGIIGILTIGDKEPCDTMEKVLIAGMVTPVSPFLNWITKQIRG